MWSGGDEDENGGGEKGLWCVGTEGAAAVGRCSNRVVLGAGTVEELEEATGGAAEASSGSA